MIYQPLGGVQGQATNLSLVADLYSKSKQNLFLLWLKNVEKRLEKLVMIKNGYSRKISVKNNKK